MNRTVAHPRLVELVLHLSDAPLSQVVSAVGRVEPAEGLDPLDHDAHLDVVASALLALQGIDLRETATAAGPRAEVELVDS